MSPKMSEDMKAEIAKSSEKMQKKLSMENIKKIEKSRKKMQEKFEFEKDLDWEPNLDRTYDNIRKLRNNGWKNQNTGSSEIFEKNGNYTIRLYKGDIVHKKIEKGATLKFTFKPSEILNEHHKSNDWYEIWISGSCIPNGGKLVYVQGEENAKKIVKAGNDGKVSFFGMELK